MSGVIENDASISVHIQGLSLNDIKETPQTVLFILLRLTMLLENQTVKLYTDSLMLEHIKIGMILSL